MEKRQERQENIVLLNLMAIILVILGHSGCIYAGKWDYNVVYKNSIIIKYLTNYIYSFHMPLFVFISGYLYSYGKANDKYKSLKELFCKKFKRLIMPYLFIGIFFMLPIQMIFHMDNISSSYFKRVLNEIILANKPRHLWFILMLFNLFIIFYLIENYLNRNKIISNLLILFVISILSVKIPNIYQVSQSVQYLLFFYIGYIFYRYKKIINTTKDKFLIFFIAHILLFNFDFFKIDRLSEQGNYIIYIKLFKLLSDKVIALVGVVSIFELVQFLFSKRYDKVHRLMGSKLFREISNNSFFIYLVHQPIMLIILKEIRNMPIKPIIVYNILFWITLMISLGVTNIYNTIIKKFLFCTKKNIHLIPNRDRGND